MSGIREMRLSAHRVAVHLCLERRLYLGCGSGERNAGEAVRSTLYRKASLLQPLRHTCQSLSVMPKRLAYCSGVSPWW